MDALPIEVNDSPTPLADARFKPELYTVRPIRFQQARRLIEWGHYTHSLTKGRHSFGLFRENRLIGAAVYGQPSGRHVAQSFWDGADERNTLELLRLFVMDGTGKNAETWFMARCHRLLPEEVKCLIAYSAPGVGHHGGCYQAGNWLHLGESMGGQNYYYTDAHGNYVNKRIPWQYGPRNGLPYGEKESAKILGLTRVDEPRKMVYALPLDRRIIKKLRREILPYPKPDQQSSHDPAPLDAVGYA